MEADRAFMELEYPAGQGEAEAKTGHGEAVVAAVEGLEDLLPFLLPYPPALVFHGDGDLFCLDGQPDGGVVVVGVFAGIGDDIPDGGEEQVFIAEDQQLFLGFGQFVEVEGNGEEGVCLCEFRGEPQEDLIDADEVDLQSAGRARGPGKFQQGLGEFAQLPGVLVHRLDHLPVFLHGPHPLQGYFQLTGDGGQGSREFVGGVGDKAALDLEALLQAVEQLVQRIGEVIPFVSGIARGGPDAAGKVSGRDVVHLVGDAFYRVEEADGKEIAADDGDEYAADKAQGKDEAEVAEFFVAGLVIGRGNNDKGSILVGIIKGDGVLYSLGEVDPVLAFPGLVEDVPVCAKGVGGVVAVPVDTMVGPVIGFHYLIFHRHGGGGVDLADEGLIEDAALAQEAAGGDGAIGEACLDILYAVGVRKVVDRCADESKDGHHEEGKEKRYAGAHRHQLGWVFRM